MAVDPEVNFYMKVPLGDGTFTNGRIDYNAHPRMLGLETIDLSGKRILDIAANDGFWTFWAEGRGASDLLAIDIDGFEDYDWGHGGPPAHIAQQMAGNSYSQWAEAGRGFRELHSHFGSTANRETMSVYDLDPERHGTFDLIFNYGLLYHLRHPLLSLDRTRLVCGGALILETHVINTFRNMPISLFYWDDAFRVYSNWTGPTEAVVAAWLRSAGFGDVWVRRPSISDPQGRAVFAAAVSDEWRERFHAAPALHHLDEAYVAESNRMVRALVGE